MSVAGQRVPSEIFKAYDIRGIVERALTPEVTQLIGQAIGSEARDRGVTAVAIGRDGRLYATGHDHTELYVLDIPKGGGALKLVATVDIPVPGQAIVFDPGDKGVMFGVDRARREVVGFRLPPLEGP